MDLGGEIAQRNLFNQLRQGSVYFSYLEGERAHVAGSGVIADLAGTKVVLTAAHVLEAFRRKFDAGEMCLSVNRPRGRFVVKPEFPRLSTPRADEGLDAGVIIIPDSDAATYFNFGGFEPPGARTLSVSAPPVGIECAVAGWPASLAVPIQEEDSDEKQGIRGCLLFIGTGIADVDDAYLWLALDKTMTSAIRGEVEVRPGDLAGMSGCGCWIVEGDPARLGDPSLLDDPEALRANPPVGLSLFGIHTATGNGRLRESRLSNHLRLLAAMNATMRDKVSRLWPTLDLP